MIKNMKGKETLSDKISSANITEWKDHKLIEAAFFLDYLKYYVKSDQIAKTYEELSDIPKNISKEVIEYCEDSISYKKLGDNQRKSIEEYGRKVRELYLKNGLSSVEAQERLLRDGENRMPEKKKIHWFFKLFHELTTIFALLLWSGGALALVAFGLNPSDNSNLWLGIILWFVVFITGSFAFWQNSKSDNIVESFKSFSNAKATVVRDGKAFTIPGIDLVIGDVVKIGLGEKIPADIRIFSANSFSVNNSGLTGESEAIKLSEEVGEKGCENPLDAKNIAFFSTNCVLGGATGIVIKTGKETFMGKIADLTNSAVNDVVGIEVELNRFIKIISIIAITLGLGFLFGSMGIGFPLIASFSFAIGIIVANVPEGLLSCLTVTLALTAYKLYQKNVMVKNMGSIETLGAITCICSDKTGTLTQNRMSVVHLWYDCEVKKIMNNQYDIQVDSNVIKLKIFDKDDPTFKYFQFGAICGSSSSFKTETSDDFQSLIQERNKWNKSNPKATSSEISAKVEELKRKFQKDYDIFYKNNIDERLTDGDASEAGIIKFFEKVENIKNIRQRFPQHRCNGEDIKIPFNSTIKCASFLRKIEDNSDPESNFYVAFKGAPDYLIKRCTHYMLNGKEYEIDDYFKNKFKEANQIFALKGERVLAIAYYKLKKNEFNLGFEFKNDTGIEGEGGMKVPNYPIDQLCFVGLIGMEDPPREGVRDAIAICKKAGIKIIMVTGDQTLTAASIAYQIGIIENLDDTPEVIQSKENLRSLEEAEKKSNTIIIDGGRLNKALKADETLSEDNPNKGAFLRNWIMKRDCVFARTSPDQKLIIVDACQKLGHVVAVTGDGVNDSPAIKKADIGIAMGKVGTDVAKDAADILLMDNNFANIVKGIKQGRVIFDTLKKIIAYNLCSNIPELIPVIGYFIFAFPIPLTTILILTIDIGSDVYPNIAFAYEGAEFNIMDRSPRNSKTENLCTLKLFAWTYLHMGMVESTGPMLTYFVVMNDYGLTPTGIMGLTTEYGIEPSPTDVYNPYDKFKGNSNAFLYENAERLGIEGVAFINEDGDEIDRQIDFVSNDDNLIDFRVFFYHLKDDTWGDCHYNRESYKKGGQVCWSMEAVRHSQSAYLANVVFIQVSTGLGFRTITVSIFHHIFDNHDLNLAYLLENIIMCTLIYVPGLNYGLMLRPILIQHWVPCFGAFIILFFFAEFTKYLIRNAHNPDGSRGFFNKYYRY